jgi:hypothetical protein
MNGTIFLNGERYVALKKCGHLVAFMTFQWKWQFSVFYVTLFMVIDFLDVFCILQIWDFFQ